MPNALVTGGSAGLGLAISLDLAGAGYSVTIDGRRPEPLRAAATQLRAALPPGAAAQIQAVAGDVRDAAHRTELVRRAADLGPIDTVINNASELGGSPPPRLRDLEPAVGQRLWQVNVEAPVQLIRTALPFLAERAAIITVSSDAAVEHYQGWGGYGATKAALDHHLLTFAVEEPQFTWYAVDPGDLRTAMHQAAFPGEDISDRPEPATVSPVIVGLIRSGLGSGRYRAAELRQRGVGTSPRRVPA